MTDQNTHGSGAPEPDLRLEEARPDELVDYLRRASVAVYIAMDAVAADDLSPRLKQAAHEIESLRMALAELRTDFGRIADIAGQHDCQQPTMPTAGEGS